MLIGAAGGSAVMYRAMTSLGFAQASHYKGPIRLDGDPKGASVLILGAGLAGMVAALELRKAGYRVHILEYQDRAGGRCWTLRGGDEYVELGGARQVCGFDAGLYLNPGPWRIPFHHHALLDYCKRLGVALQPFVQVNHNAYLHASRAFGGKPQRYGHVQSDLYGHVAELLAKAARRDMLDEAVSGEDKAILLEALKLWGALDENHLYREGAVASERRGWAVEPRGGLDAAPAPSRPIGLDDLLRSGIWQNLGVGLQHEYQTPLFQPVGGMDAIGKAFAREVGDLIQFGAKVTAVLQDAGGVTVVYIDERNGGQMRQAKADWCLCTIPLPILGQLELNVGAALQNAIDAVAYAPAVKVGLQFRRRFWEEDEGIFGGISFTDLPITQISYPSADFLQRGKGVLLGAYAFGVHAVEFTAMSPEERLKRAVEDGARIHPQYRDEFENGISVAWHRVPWALGCNAIWTAATRAEHYRALCEIDGRVMLAGEHASYLSGWQEGAILSALDAVERLHRRVLAG